MGMGIYEFITSNILCWKVGRGVYPGMTHRDVGGAVSWNDYYYYIIIIIQI